MSKENRKKVYDKLVKDGTLWKDDGALAKEFGQAPTPKGAMFETSEKPAKKGKK